MRPAPLVVAALGLAFAACGGSSSAPARTGVPSAAATVAASPSQAPTLTATATVSLDAARCRLDPDGCAFAVAVVEWIREANVDALIQASAPQPLPCYGSAQGLGGNDPLCDGSVAGESRDGFLIHRLNSDGGTAVADFRPDLRGAILNRNGNIDAIGVQCPEKNGNADCGHGFVLFLSGAPNIVVEPSASHYSITALQFGDFAEDRSLLRNGGVFPMPWKGTALPGGFVAWRPDIPGPGAEATIQRWLDAPLAVPKLTLTPPEGPCPRTLTVSGRGFTETLKDPKDPRLQIQLFPGRYGSVPPDIRPRPAFTLGGPVKPDGTWEETVTLAEGDGYVCAAGIITVLVGGPEWGVAYYRVR